MRRHVGWLSLMVVGLAVGAARTARAEGERPGRHPHFDDQGTLTWHTRLADALAAARAEGKLVFVEYGRLRCKQCRVLVSKVLPAPEVRERVARVAVGLAVDCDAPEACVDALLRQRLGETGILPYVGFLAEDGRWVTGFSGGRTVAEFLGDLEVAERALRRCAGSATPAPSVPAPLPVAAPTAPAGQLTLRAPEPVAPPPVPSVVAAAPRVVVVPGRTPPAVVDPDVRRREAVAAAEAGAWSEVMRHCRHGSPRDPVLVGLRARARAWAEERLAFAVSAGRGGRFEEAVFAASRVKEALRGEPEGEDAARGLEALHVAREVARVGPASPQAAALRQGIEGRLRGTRWAALLS